MKNNNITAIRLSIAIYVVSEFRYRRAKTLDLAITEGELSSNGLDSNYGYSDVGFALNHKTIHITFASLLAGHRDQRQ